jgi:hypothetical protein
MGYSRVKTRRTIARGIRVSERIAAPTSEWLRKTQTPAE